MTYFETTLINGSQRIEFDLPVNPQLYDFLTGHDNAQSFGEDWFDITLNEKDVQTIKELCKTNEEKELLGSNLQEGTIIDILIHRIIHIGDDYYDK